MFYEYYSKKLPVDMISCFLYGQKLFKINPPHWKNLFIYSVSHKKYIYQEWRYLWWCVSPGKKSDCACHHRRSHTGARQRAAALFQPRATNSWAICHNVRLHPAISTRQLLKNNNRIFLGSIPPRFIELYKSRLHWVRHSGVVVWFPG